MEYVVRNGNSIIPASLRRANPSLWHDRLLQRRHATTYCTSADLEASSCTDATTSMTSPLVVNYHTITPAHLFICCFWVASPRQTCQKHARRRHVSPIVIFRSSFFERWQCVSLVRCMTESTRGALRRALLRCKHCEGNGLSPPDLRPPPRSAVPSSLSARHIFRTHQIYILIDRD